MHTCCDDSSREIKALPPEAFATLFTVRERIEFEATSSVVYLVECTACHCTRSLEVFSDEEALLYRLNKSMNGGFIEGVAAPSVPTANETRGRADAA